jgi:hypothetical protein
VHRLLGSQSESLNTGFAVISAAASVVNRFVFLHLCHTSPQVLQIAAGYEGLLSDLEHARLLATLSVIMARREFKGEADRLAAEVGARVHLPARGGHLHEGRMHMLSTIACLHVL